MLTLDQNLGNFVLKSVSNSTNEIGITNGQEWCNVDFEATNTNTNTSTNTSTSTNTNTNTNANANVNGNESNSIYFMKIHFTANRYGTYRQNIILYFGEYPVILQRICMDCLPTKDFARILDATNYQFSQNPKTWMNETLLIQQFRSPVVPPRDSMEDKLSTIYPYPDKNNFFLTQETLTDAYLTQENYRGRLHELITVEELARHEQIARYNVISHMRLLSHYILTSMGDASTIAKYAPTGELFAQVRLLLTVIYFLFFLYSAPLLF